jgi:hypothetical protein
LNKSRFLEPGFSWPLAEQVRAIFLRPLKPELIIGPNKSWLAMPPNESVKGNGTVHDEKSDRRSVRQSQPRMSDGSSILDSVHAVETGKETALLHVCENPLCTFEFPESGLNIEPRRYCSPECRQQASLIRRVAALLDGLSDSAVIAILRKQNDAVKARA